MRPHSLRVGMRGGGPTVMLALHSSDTEVPGLPGDPGVPATMAVLRRLPSNPLATCDRMMTDVDAPGARDPRSQSTVLPATLHRTSLVVTLMSPAGRTS